MRMEGCDALAGLAGLGGGRKGKTVATEGRNETSSRDGRFSSEISRRWLVFLES